MKKFFTACLLGFALTSLAATPAWEEVKVKGSTRKMLVHIPDDMPSKAPLVISCHGMNQDPNYQCFTNSKWTAVADTAKFAMVFPQGNGNSWDIGGEGDINFMRELIKYMKEKYDINTCRVYLSGFSMGGMFTYHCANNAPELFAAFVPVSGYPMWDKTVKSARPVPIMHVHGTGDDVCVFSGVQPTLDNWIKRNECNKTPEVIKPYPSNKKYSGATLRKWTGGLEGVEVQLLEFKDKGHWQSEDPSSCLTSVEAWNFMKRWTLTPTVEKVEPEQEAFDLPTDGGEIVLTFDVDIVGDGVEATLKSGETTLNLESNVVDNVLTLTVPPLEPGQYDLTVKNVSSPSGEVLKSFTTKYAYGYEAVTEIPEDDFVITDDMTLAQRYKGSFLFTLRKAKETYSRIPEKNLKKYNATALRDLIKRYETFEADTPSKYQVVIDKLNEAIEKVATLTGVDVISDDSSVVTVEYYNLDGVKISNPGQGVVIERRVYDDGTEKMIKRVMD